MQNPIQKVRRRSIVFKKSGILSENLKNLASSNYSTVQYFLLNFHTFPTYQCLQKYVWDFFLFCLDLAFFSKIKNTWFLQTRFLHFH